MEIDVNKLVYLLLLIGFVYLVYKTIFYKGIMPSETGFRFSSGL